MLTRSIQRHLMHKRRSAVLRLQRDAEVAALNEVMSGATLAYREGARDSLALLWEMARTMDPVAMAVTKPQVDKMVRFHLASRIDYNLYSIDPIALDWVRFFYDGLPCLADRGQVGGIDEESFALRPEQFQPLRQYLRSALMSDPLYVRDLEILARQGTPRYGLTPEVLIEEEMSVRCGDKWLLRSDLRQFFTCYFRHTPEELKFYFR